MSTYELHHRHTGNRLTKLSGTIFLILLGAMIGTSLALVFILQQIGNLGIN